MAEKYITYKCAACTEEWVSDNETGMDPNQCPVCGSWHTVQVRILANIENLMQS